MKEAQHIFQRLPSTSPANARMTLDAKVQVWRAVKKTLQSDLGAVSDGHIVSGWTHIRRVGRSRPRSCLSRLSRATNSGSSSGETSPQCAVATTPGRCSS
jgi:hypothetical protein